MILCMSKLSNANYLSKREIIPKTLQVPLVDHLHLLARDAPIHLLATGIAGDVRSLLRYAKVLMVSKY